MDDECKSILRCPHCRLRQFCTLDGRCRKCHGWLRPQQELFVPPPPPPEPPKIQEGWGPMFAMIRQGSGLSQKELSAKAKCVRTYISKIESRNQPPTIATVERFAKALKIPLDALVSADDARAYYSKKYLLSDPFLREIHSLTSGLDQQQLQIVLHAVYSLAVEHQTVFPEWMVVPATRIEVAA